MTSTMNPRYWPLEADDSIRLAVLHPGSREECIRLSLVYTTISENPVYSALSYEWGSNKLPVQVYMNGILTAMGQNLQLALVHLRSTSQERLLWIDAICIDQNNINERNSQMRLMGDIYSKADTVIIWLGPAMDTSDIAMQWICESSSQSNDLLGLRRKSLGCLSASQIIQQQVKKWRALDDLCSRDYWHRVWIVQEVVLAGQLVICCGNREAKWDGFSNLMADYDALFKPKSCLGAISRIRQSLPAGLLLLRKMYRTSSGGCTLLDLMQMTRDSLSSDPRDKVYGLLGLASDGYDFRRAIDYSKSLLEMYQSLWHSLVSANSPSTYYKISEFFNCTLKNTPFEPSAETDISRSDLYVLGRSVGTIVYVGQPWCDFWSKDIYNDDREWYSAMEELRTQGLPVDQQIRIFQAAFSRTKYILTDPFSSNNGNFKASTCNTTAPNHELDEEIEIHPEDLHDQSLIVLSGGQIAIAMSSACVGDHIYQFQDRRVNVVCCYESEEMKCTAIFPWRRDDERTWDAPITSTVTRFHVVSGTPIECLSKPGIEIPTNINPEGRPLLEVSIPNARPVNQVIPSKSYSH